MTTIETDLLIIGGGLAGLSLAYQVKRAEPHLDITVLERNVFPLPEKVAKVGESTVEIGSHYLKETLGLAEQFDVRHLRKYGLRCFFGAPQNDFAQQDELGVSQLFGIPTYQIDRGAIENQLYELLSGMGVRLCTGVVTESLDISADQKSVVYKTLDSNEYTKAQSKWLVDAAGRQALIKNHLGLQRPVEHRGNAVWFRVDRQLKLDEWSNDAQWQSRVKDADTRWLSTNHLMGPGYWVWVIPLDNGATSIGVVMDDEAFESHDFSTVDNTLQWLSEHHPRCAAALAGAPVLDYVVIRDYAQGCQQVFSEDGWALSGESGLFSDPFYSPGTDFIAISNTFIQDLISRSVNGEDIRFPSRLYQSMYESFFASTLSLYTGQYGGFGDRRMMGVKLVWDYAYYWGVLSLLFFKQSMTDIPLMRQLNPGLQAVQALNRDVQARFRERAKQRVQLPAKGLFLNQYEVPALRYFNAVLLDPTIGAAEAMPENVDKLTRLASYLSSMLDEHAPSAISAEERELLGDYRAGVLA